MWAGRKYFKEKSILRTITNGSYVSYCHWAGPILHTTSNFSAIFFYCQTMTYTIILQMLNLTFSNNDPLNQSSLASDNSRFPQVWHSNFLLVFSRLSATCYRSDIVWLAISKWVCFTVNVISGGGGPRLQRMEIKMLRETRRTKDACNSSRNNLRCLLQN